MTKPTGSPATSAMRKAKRGVAKLQPPGFGGELGKEGAKVFVAIKMGKRIAEARAKHPVDRGRIDEFRIAEFGRHANPAGTGHRGA